MKRRLCCLITLNVFIIFWYQLAKRYVDLEEEDSLKTAVACLDITAFFNLWEDSRVYLAAWRHFKRKRCSESLFLQEIKGHQATIQVLSAFMIAEHKHSQSPRNPSCAESGKSSGFGWIGEEGAVG